jgi:two-component system response regulator FixJ
MNRNWPVIVVDDEACVRNSMRQLLESWRYPVSVFGSATEFLEADLPSRFCLLLDICMPGMDGMELHKEVRRRGLSVPVVFMTGYSEVALAVRAMKAGAVDFLEKPISAQTLLASVESALRDIPEAPVPAVKENVFKVRLTVRELEILGRITMGRSNKVTALELGLSPRTVELYRARAMRKLGAKNLADLVRIYLAATSNQIAKSEGPITQAWG